MTLPTVQSPSQRKPKRGLFVLGILILIAVSFLAGLGVSRSRPNITAYRSTASSTTAIGYFDEQLYAEVLSTLKETYVERQKIDEKKLFYGALQGLVAAIGDPYTAFFSPAEHQQFNEELKGSFEGIGAELGVKEGRLTVIAPLADSPAEKAGLRAGDVILTIDSKESGSLTLDQAVALIRGKAGTIVILTVYRKDNGNTSETISIRRATIVLPTVKVAVADGIAVINLYNFNNESERQFIKTINDLRTRNIRGLIVDLRNNPGGFLDKSVNIASAWLAKDDLVVREVYYDERLTKDYRAIRQIQAPKVPTVVLVNEGSASASEILAGALQDYAKATIVGSKTYGKGSVQDLKTLRDGSGLKVTISQWITPKGRFINNHGIEPDSTVPMTAEDFRDSRDPQLEKAKQIIQGRTQ